MENRRRRPGDYNGGFEDSRQRRSMAKKPPRSAANWKPTVPYWEKKFCKDVCAMDWDTFLDRKKFVHLYDNVVKWDDSAGEEAFNNAKKQFSAQLHGWPCEISCPSPDLYIDEIDWDAQVDLQPLLELELERESLVSNKPEVHDEPVIIFGDTLINDLGLSPAGWGDEDENFKKAAKSSWNNLVNPWDQIEETTMENNEHVGFGHDANPVDKGCEVMVDKGWDEDWLKMESNEKNGVHDAAPVDKGCEVVVDMGWDDDWLKMESNEKNGVHEAAPAAWQVNNGGPYETSYGSSRYINNNNYKGRYRWRNGSNGKREMMV